MEDFFPESLGQKRGCAYTQQNMVHLQKTQQVFEWGSDARKLTNQLTYN